jgi:LETM1 and EF-hand domain-containing protein 1
MELADAGVATGEAGDTLVEQEDSAVSMLEFLAKARNGEMIPPDVIVRYATYFQDDLTLDNMPRMQLINMCKYMSIPPYGSDAFLRFQLRHRIRVLKEDDQRILWEGIDSLTKMELREACQERGMRSTGLSKDAYKQSLQQWLDLSVHKNVPISLLIMSRIFFLRDELFEPKPADEVGSKSLSGLADAMSAIDKEVLDHVILEVATSKEKQSDPDIRKLKLEIVSKQNELIRQEEADRKAKAKRKEAEKAEETAGISDASSVTVVASEPVAAAVSSDPKLTSETAGAKSEPELPSGNEPRDRDLSTAEMEAISQLVSRDPVSKERAELERIKAAIRPSETELRFLEPSIEDSDATLVEAPRTQPSSTQSDRAATNSESTDSGAVPKVDATDHDGKPREDDPVIDRLKKRLETMVDKIEVQLSQAEVKIGDKLHFLDKDRDGVLSREEMADVLQQVLKRKISFDEAMEIAGAMVRLVLPCIRMIAVSC